MIHHDDQVPSMPKAFIFPTGQATLWALPINDNHSKGKPFWQKVYGWYLLGGLILVAWAVISFL